MSEGRMTESPSTKRKRKHRELSAKGIRHVSAWVAENDVPQIEAMANTVSADVAKWDRDNKEIPE